MTVPQCLLEVDLVPELTGMTAESISILVTEFVSIASVFFPLRTRCLPNQELYLSLAHRDVLMVLN